MDSLAAALKAASEALNKASQEAELRNNRLIILEGQVSYLETENNKKNELQKKMLNLLQEYSE